MILWTLFISFRPVGMVSQLVTCAQTVTVYSTATITSHSAGTYFFSFSLRVYSP